MAVGTFLLGCGETKTDTITEANQSKINVIGVHLTQRTCLWVTKSEGKLEFRSRVWFCLVERGWCEFSFLDQSWSGAKIVRIRTSLSTLNGKFLWTYNCLVFFRNVPAGHSALSPPPYDFGGLTTAPSCSQVNNHCVCVKQARSHLNPFSDREVLYFIF